MSSPPRLTDCRESDCANIPSIVAFRQHLHLSPPTNPLNCAALHSIHLPFPCVMSTPPLLKKESSPLLLTDDGDSFLVSPRSGFTDKYSLSPDPTHWGSSLSPNDPEPDDDLHDPESKGVHRPSDFVTGRGLANLGCIALVAIALVGLFLGYPVGKFVTQKVVSNEGSANVRVNATGQVASIGNFGLIDLDTPSDAYTITSLHSGKEMQLVFSDEFTTDGRSFYPGDDPYWTAEDLHYWSTNNLEWYDPVAVTTANGSLKITLSATPTHGLNYQGGLLTTWNKFCFTGGMLVTSATLPGTNNIHGLWPAFWAMGNLGRAGYGASLDGMWPYTYDACDVGTAPNQTLNGLPEIARTSGSMDPTQPYDGELSYQPGQRLSRCTCPGESHPGPIHSSDGSYVGRSAPEIDVFEAQISGENLGTVSQSGQWAPFNAGYVWFNTSDNLVIADPDNSIFNTYIGGAYQQATSVVTNTNQKCYELLDGCFSVYGFEYKPGFGDSYISWIADNKLAWTINAGGLAADTQTEISARPVPQEPMYIIANLGMSNNFGAVDLANLTFPTTLSLDYVRVYQYPDAINIGCDPPDFPTQDYINTYLEAYTNPLLTTWVDDYNQTIPKNSFVEPC
ncbi:beta-glucan synthesis-associated [Mycena rosella]|uniref:Beta-glucan synthesis-associated n=1 Tax=Mycena rosella TaxID=1033263 RepID=A0AAD7CXF7_MYCRO|nr:beta-glucan synthesis-associated [Mycena rosella]